MNQNTVCKSSLLAKEANGKRFFQLQHSFEPVKLHRAKEGAHSFFPFCSENRIPEYKQALVFECSHSAATEARDVNTSRVCLFTWVTHTSGPFYILQSADEQHAVEKTKQKSAEKHRCRETERIVPRAEFADTYSSPGYRRKRRSSSFLFTRTSALGLADLAGVDFLERHVGLRGRKI